jgi:hypothetical protein
VRAPSAASYRYQYCRAGVQVVTAACADSRPVAFTGFGDSFSFSDLSAGVWHMLRIDGSMLLHLTDEDLLGDLGMRSGIHRKAVLRAIQALALSQGIPAGADSTC